MDNYEDGSSNKKSLTRKSKNKNRKMRQKYNEFTAEYSYNSKENTGMDWEEDLDDWYGLDDDPFEKFSNGKR